ncbi:arsenite S-adenosylmethyltransferase [Dictyobacter sp. S3.2.2.5]|uniref:Arsenite methyltransferase n=1 Tax=Dictyobacter halimunensis TaxID=3026934 RepID=A0ABQ6FNU1_9CHLR|nr:arsenite S-adenosylmethyltransferase [Dictyobacter sp. S3.2.2.5]
MNNTVPEDGEQLRAAVRERYSRSVGSILTNQSDSINSCCSTPPSIQNAGDAASTGCCSTDCCSTSQADPITGDLYNAAELGTLPIAAVLASRGCGNPTALAELKEGEKVLDLGSGGGIDVLLSARRVGPGGFAYGLDMTDDMLAIAERNRQEAGIQNVQFLKGIIEDIPLPDNSIDVVISNCVINLAADKGQVLREAQRVLVPGGRFAVSDIIFQGQIPPALRSDLESWAGCIAGALEENVYRQLLQQAGFTDIEVEVTRRYTLEEIASGGARASISALNDEERQQTEGKFVSAFIRARKPASQA